VRRVVLQGHARASAFSGGVQLRIGDDLRAEIAVGRGREVTYMLREPRREKGEAARRPGL
jgi:hypothetical protein